MACASTRALLFAFFFPLLLFRNKRHIATRTICDRRHFVVVYFFFFFLSFFLITYVSFFTVFWYGECRIFPRRCHQSANSWRSSSYWTTNYKVGITRGIGGTTGTRELGVRDLMTAAQFFFSSLSLYQSSLAKKKTTNKQINQDVSS